MIRRLISTLLRHRLWLFWAALAGFLIALVIYGRQTQLQSWQFVKMVGIFFVLNSLILFLAGKSFRTIQMVMVSYILVLELITVGFFTLRYFSVFQ